MGSTVAQWLVLIVRRSRVRLWAEWGFLPVCVKFPPVSPTTKNMNNRVVSGAMTPVKETEISEGSSWENKGLFTFLIAFDTFGLSLVAGKTEFM